MDRDTTELIALSRMRATLAFALAFTLLLTLRLWLPSMRTYPLAPVFDGLPSTPFPWDAAALVAAFAALVAIAAAKRTRLATAVLLSLAVAAALGDQTRWMPYFTLHVFLLAFVGFTDGTPKDATLRMHACRLALAAVYFWAGAHKLNAYFIATEMPAVVGPFARQFGLEALVLVLAIVSPFAEMAIGVGLLVPAVRRAALYGALLMHGFILALYGSGGLAFIAPVWFWNFAMMALVLVAFFDAPWTFSDMLRVRRSRRVAALLGVVFVAVPAASFVVPVDTYVAWGIFTGDKAAMRRLSVSEDAYGRLPKDVRLRFSAPGADGRRDVSLRQWAISELGVFTYPEVRTYRQVARSLCAHADSPDDVQAEIEGKPDRFDGSREVFRYDCGTL